MDDETPGAMDAETLGARFIALGFSFEWTQNFIRSRDRDEAEVELALTLT